MTKTLVLSIAAALLAVSTTGHAASLSRDELRRAPEGCEAVNPGQPSCSFTVQETMEGPVAGAAGVGSWSVKIKRGKKKISMPSSSGYGEPSSVSILFKKGDKVTAEATAPGSSVVAGGD